MLRTDTARPDRFTARATSPSKEVCTWPSSDLHLGSGTRPTRSSLELLSELQGRCISARAAKVRQVVTSLREIRRRIGPAHDGPLAIFEQCGEDSIERRTR